MLSLSPSAVVSSKWALFCRQNGGVHRLAPTPKLIGGGRHFSTIREAFLGNFIIYTSNSYLAKGFCGAFGLLAVGGGILFSPAASILVLSVGLRLATVPLVIYRDRLASRRLLTVSLIRQQVYEKIGAHYALKTYFDEQTGKWALDTQDPFILKSAEDTVRKNVAEHVREKRLWVGRIIALHGCTLPIWIYCSMGLVKFIETQVDARLGGFLWVSSLAQADPYMVLPLCVGAFAFLNIWSNRWAFMSTEAHYRLTARLMDALLVLITVYFTHMLTEAPALVSLYWCCALSTGLLQTLLLRNPKVKRLLGIGPLSSDTTTPFRDLFRRRRLPPTSMF